jgi:cyclase
MTYRIATVMFACLGGVGAAAAAQPQPVPLSAQPLKGGVYWVKGGNGANTGFIVGATDVVVIDAKTVAESSQAMLAEIRKVTPNPVTTVILTHSDGDHVNGLAGLPQGLTIIAHASAKKDMQEAFKDPKMSALLPYLPTRTVEGDRPPSIGGAGLTLRHFGPAHTSGDLVVLIPRERIAFIGDLAFLGRDPLIHRQKGGTSLGLVRTLRGILALDADTFISGHNDPLTKADIRGLLTSIEEKQAKVKALIGQGKSLDEIKTAFGLAEAADPSARRRPGLVEIIYLDLK